MIAVRGSDAVPVLLVPSRFSEWRDRYATVQQALGGVLPAAVLEHIGSTAVPELPSKDVVDVLIGVTDEGQIVASAATLAAESWDLEGHRDGHAWFSWPRRTERRAVAHIVVHGGDQWNDRVDFRELLRAHPTARDAYLAAKRDAAREASDWGDYTAKKAEVVFSLLAAERLANAREDEVGEFAEVLDPIGRT